MCISVCLSVLGSEVRNERAGLARRGELANRVQLWGPCLPPKAKVSSRGSMLDVTLRLYYFNVIH